MGFVISRQISYNNNRKILKKENYFESKSKGTHNGLYKNVKACDSLLERFEKQADFNAHQKDLYKQKAIPITIAIGVVSIFLWFVLNLI